MTKKPNITCLFIDIGGVLLTNGWDHHARHRAVKKFGLSWPEMESRHELYVEPYELGYIRLEEYLERVIFFQKRPFSLSQFRQFVFDQSKPYGKMIELVARLKRAYGLKVVVVSNEGRELNAYRIEKFELANLADFFVSSCFVHLRKPDEEIYQLALDVSGLSAERVLYLENTPAFIQVAQGLGIGSILHKDYPTTLKRLSSWGLAE